MVPGTFLYSSAQRGRRGPGSWEGRPRSHPRLSPRVARVWISPQLSAAHGSLSAGLEAAAGSGHQDDPAHCPCSVGAFKSGQGTYSGRGETGFYPQL